MVAQVRPQIFLAVDRLSESTLKELTHTYVGGLSFNMLSSKFNAST